MGAVASSWQRRDPPGSLGGCKGKSGPERRSIFKRKKKRESVMQPRLKVNEYVPDKESAFVAFNLNDFQTCYISEQISERGYENLPHHWQNEKVKRIQNLDLSTIHAEENSPMDCPGENISRALMVLPKLPDATQNPQEDMNEAAYHTYENIGDQAIELKVTGEDDCEHVVDIVDNIDTSGHYARASYHSNLDPSNKSEDLANTKSVLPLALVKNTYATVRTASTGITVVDRENSRNLQEIHQGSIRGKPISNVINCLPHNSRFSETIMFRIPVRGRTGGKLEVLYSPTDENEDPIWQILQVVEGTNETILTDWSDPPNYVVLPVRDENHAVFLLRHFCAFVIIENGHKELVNIAKVSVYLNSYLSLDKLVVDVLVIAGCNEESMKERKQLASDQSFKLVELKSMTVFNSKDDIQVSLSDVSWEKDIVKHNDTQLTLSKLLILHDSFDMSRITRTFRNVNNRKSHYNANLTLCQLPDGKKSTFLISSPIKHESVTNVTNKCTCNNVKKSTGTSGPSESSYIICLTCSSSETIRPITPDKKVPFSTGETRYSMTKCTSSITHFREDRSVENTTHSLEDEEYQSRSEVRVQPEQHKDEVSRRKQHTSIQVEDNQNVNDKPLSIREGKGLKGIPTDDEDNLLMGEAVGGVGPEPPDFRIFVEKYLNNSARATGIANSEHINTATVPNDEPWQYLRHNTRAHL